jgi:hypothetical protein
MMKNLCALWTRLAEEVGQACRVSTALDAEYVERRVEAEGVSFLTITLPAFGKALESCLRTGVYDPELFAGFRKQQTEPFFPVFLGGFFAHVFNASGTIGPRVNVAQFSVSLAQQSVWAIRQLTLFFSKVEIECSDERKMAAIEKYVDIESELKTREQETDDEDPFGPLFVESLSSCFPGYFPVWMTTSLLGISWDVMALVTPQIVFLATPSTILRSGQSG